jgi:DnaJ family protein C protein 8
VLAKAEWRRRKLTKRLAEETERGAEEAKEGRERAKKTKEADKAWESTRESRVGSWRDFVKSKGGKKATGQLKPPKAATVDADKAFVRRPVGEQFKPPPPPAGR